jgi:dolichol-phosphate mannosyltransferase
LDRLARQFSEVRVVHLSRNFGQQAAIHAGLTQARGDAVVIMDADLQDPPEAINELLTAWQTGHDVVYAMRMPQQKAFWNRSLSAVFQGFLLSDDKGFLPENSGSFGLIDARVAQIMLALGETNRNLAELRNWVGFRQIGIPIERVLRDDDRLRISQRKKVRPTKPANAYSAAPLSMLRCLGGISLLVFLAIGGYSIFCELFTDLATPAWASRVAIVSFFAALNALGMGILGEYLVRIYNQVRARPLYLVDRTVNCAAAEEGVQTATDNANGETLLPRTDGLGLERLDPLEIDSGWDDTYQHLLDQAQGLLELGDLVRSEADDLADRQGREFAGTDRLTDPAPAVNMPHAADQAHGSNDAADEPHVLKLSKAPSRR